MEVLEQSGCGTPALNVMAIRDQQTQTSVNKECYWLMSTLLCLMAWTISRLVNVFREMNRNKNDSFVLGDCHKNVSVWITALLHFLVVNICCICFLMLMFHFFTVLLCTDVQCQDCISALLRYMYMANCLSSMVMQGSAQSSGQNFRFSYMFYTSPSNQNSKK